MKASHLKFAEHYAVHGNATEAYSLAYPKASTRAACASNGEKLLRRPDIKEFLEKKQVQFQKECLLSRDEVLFNLKNIAELNIKKAPATAIKALELIVRMQGYINQDNSPTDNGEKITINLNLD